jgi:hypothetical protein
MVEDRGDTPGRGRSGIVAKIRPRRETSFPLVVMPVDDAWEDVQPTRIEQFPAGVEIRPHLGDSASDDPNIRAAPTRRRHDGPAANE